MSGSRALAVVTRENCELCTELLAQLDAYQRRGQVTLTLLPLEQHPELVAQYAWRVPAVLEGDRELLWGRVEPDELVAVLGRPDCG